MDIITKYPELAQYVENINGSLRLNAEGTQQYLNQQYTEKQAAYAETIAADRNKQEAQFNNRANQIAQSTFHADGSDSYYGVDAYTVREVAKNYLNDNSLFGGDDNQINEALKELGYMDESVRQAIIQNKDAIRDLALEYQNTETSIDALTTSFLQANVENDFGDKIRESLGQDLELYTLTENQLATRVGEIAQYLLEADNDINT